MSELLNFNLVHVLEPSVDSFEFIILLDQSLHFVSQISDVRVSLLDAGIDQFYQWWYVLDLKILESAENVLYVLDVLDIWDVLSALDVLYIM